jgi:1-deoxy-D-xylulose-5-phosphate reductoisomerase
VYNAANEICVDAFHAGAIGFLDIVDTVARVVEAYADEGLRALGSTSSSLSVEEVLRADAWARTAAAGLVGGADPAGGPAHGEEP